MPKPDIESASPSRFSMNSCSQVLLSIFPGIALTAALSTLAFAMRHIPGLGLANPMVIATFLGMVLHNLIGTPKMANAGVRFSLRPVLRSGIVLLGFQLSILQVLQEGMTGCAILFTAVLATLFATKWLGRAMGIDPKLAELIAVGTSICGASAIIATNMVTQGRDEDVAYAVTCVTLFGSLAIFVYPLLPVSLHLSPKAFGLWSGASIHEIAQVVAAAFQDGAQAGYAATIAKLTRVMMLAPIVVLLGSFTGRRTAQRKIESSPPAIPLFVIGFVALMLLHSAIAVPKSLLDAIVPFTTFLLSMGLAAMGLETDFRRLKAIGWAPLGLGAIAWIFISLFSFTLIKLAAYS